ncbi:dihydrofolate reductase family protein [Neobacillus muris]|uniref:dihydrofolate reductase family protein n=1 Tax=Neobacillus muris TaxID=2941334 RepID=UPI00203B4E19|nr:dihydrofolate reductase family protein [Neobacillus muris]
MGKNRKLVLFISTSLDGYIAAKDESLDWLFKVEGEGDNGYSEFYETVDTILFGKRTYDWVMKQGIEELPYKNKECYVFTRSPLDDKEDVKFVHEDAVNFTKNLINQEGRNIWVVGGGELLHSFLKDKLVDEFIIKVAPILLGTGIPLFREGEDQVHLSLKSVRNFNQFVELHYEVKK